MNTPTSTGAPAATTSAGGGGGGGGGGPTSSPLLFFVALGFGVVFTNLWIIVGVKYCFRYNARQRARAAGEEENAELQVMPRPHRRRREKKLMTIDEVNERFPSQKYKVWRAGRERAGLSTEGGVKTAPNSRPASVRDIVALDGYEDEEHASAPPSPSAANNNPPESDTAPILAVTNKETSADTADKSIEAGTAEVTPAPPLTTVASRRLSDASALDSKNAAVDKLREAEADEEGEEGDHEDDEHAQAALPDDLLNSSGDSCAICLDVIEDDDDVRGLTCGHTFHCACLDPWLTNRRACCPLCKADYYVPKPRPDGTTGASSSNAADPAHPDAAHTRTSRGRRQDRERGNQQSASGGASGRFLGPPFRGRILFANTGGSRYGSPYFGGRNNRPGSRDPAQSAPSASAQPQQQQGRSWMRNPLAGVSVPRPFRRNREQAQPDLEAGAGSPSAPTLPTPTAR